MAKENKEKRIENKKLIIKRYGGKCQECGEKYYEFLCIDHIHNNGYLHMNTINTRRMSGNKLYVFLIKNNFPKDNFQLLCYNCNFKKWLKYLKTLNKEIKFLFPIYKDKSEKEKICKCCGIKLIKENWKRKKFKEYICQNCHNNNSTFFQRQSRIKYKEEVIKEYGGQCKCCGKNDIDILSIDHINNDGSKHRKEENVSGGKIYRWLINNNFPKKEFELLCLNCNCAKGCYGYCPHII